MIYWVVLSNTGCVLACGSSFELPAGAARVPELLNAEALTTLMVVGAKVEEFDGLPTLVAGEWHSRPKTSPPEMTSGGFALTELPEGTSVFVSCLVTGALLGTVEPTQGVITVDLPDVGKYSVEVSPPEPWQANEPFVVEIV